MKKNKNLFVDYFDEWIETYKVGAIRDVTLRKYYMTSKRLREIIPNVTIKDLDRRTYQQIINEYAKTHEKQTTMDFHHQVKGCIQDLFHDGLIDRDPTYKAIIKGKTTTRNKKSKFLQTDELKQLVGVLEIGTEINRDWFILLVAKTGLRFSEAMALTPEDFDLSNNTVTVNKTWDYKRTTGGFVKTKNESSMRTITIDWQLVGQFGPLIKNLPGDEPIFVEKTEQGKYKRIFNSTYNDYLKALCKKANVPAISMQSLRHTHASILMSAGVSLHSIADRLGHSNVTTTQETYTHIIKDLAQKDNQIMIGTLTALT
ncbi:site-specific integrase [Marinilactibacillus psychrotolerans]|uniref:site-specific integrase n=1 Tax=Marinilactibacillus psychrotolerans TaxID=191770 RepID=UPI003884EF87